MICHHYKCIFVHIPKNAGQSIEHVFLDLLGLNWETRAPLLLRYNDRPELGPPSLAHLKANEYVRYKYLTQEMFDNYFKFAIVRNPWSRTVSMYRYLGFYKKCDFKTFLFGVFKNRIFKEKNWFVGPQSNFVCNNNGDLLVNYIGKFEKLQNSFDHVCKAIGLPSIHVPHTNQLLKAKPPLLSLKPRSLIKYSRHYLGSIFNRNIPAYKTYREYYDLESRNIVAELYSRDIDLFNYKFD